MRFTRRAPLLPHAALLFALLSLGGCSGLALPALPVTLPLIQGVQLPGAIAAGGSAELTIGAFCDLFNEDDLDAMLRAAAGDLIADLVKITRVELVSVEMDATQGDFRPFTNANLTVTVLEPGTAPLALGSASNSDGLGTAFSLTPNRRLDLLGELGDGECGVPTLHLGGGGLLEPGDTTFDVRVSVLVFTAIR